MSDVDPDRLLTDLEAAAILRLSRRTLERDRRTGTGPRFVQLGRLVRYRRRDLLEYLDEHTRQRTAE